MGSGPVVVDLCYDSGSCDGEKKPACATKKRIRDALIELAEEQERGKEDRKERKGRERIVDVHEDQLLAQAQAQAGEPILLFLSHEDDADLTIIDVPADGRLSRKSNSCGGSSEKHKATATATILATPRLVHIRQPDRWSCGYRNWQMLLSYVVPRLPPDHSFYRCRSQQSRSQFRSGPDYSTTEFSREFYQIPSVRDLQVFMEQSWEDGFDTDGARHFNRTIVGKHSWIGALEVSACLSFLGIDNTVIQFIGCPQSRRELEAFCVEYFTTPRTPTTSSAATVAISSRAQATILLETTSTASTASTTSTSGFASLPLYLQWEGHSVTAIGVEQTRTTKGDTNTNLVVLNPSKTGKVIETAIRSEKLSPLRISFAHLRSKDTQVLLPSLYSLSVSEQKKLKGKPRPLTAADVHVQRAMAQGVVLSR